MIQRKQPGFFDLKEYRRNHDLSSRFWGCKIQCITHLSFPFLVTKPNGPPDFFVDSTTQDFAFH